VPVSIIKWRTPAYTIDQKLPLFGFPHYRDWNEINDFVNSQNSNNGESFGYVSNEVKTITEWYMDAKHKSDNGFYVIGITEPLSFVEDYKFVQIGGKKRVYQKDGLDGETLVRIYRVAPKD
jgi:hypothetical protein